MEKRIIISPITRLEGHGKIDILLDDQGRVADCHLQVVELRGFERFCQGRPVEELPRIMPKVCGVCPGAHHMASSKATDAVYGVSIPETAEKLRRLFYNAHVAHSHILHFFALAAPDFIPGPQAGPAKRNVLGLIDAVGEEAGRKVLTNRGHAQEIQGIICGHPIHPVSSIPGGLSKPITEAERDKIAAMGEEMVDFSRFALQVFCDLVLKNPEYAEWITGDTYLHETYYAGLVDGDGKVDFYDGEVRVVDPEGKRLAQFPASDYLTHIAERVEPWSYMKFPYLKAVGWRGIADGADSGVYRVNSLARLNVADGMKTPLAQKAYEEFYAFFGRKPVHHTLAFHWARLIENIQASEEVLRLANDPGITGTEVHREPGENPGEGVGCVEAARGTLYHHYKTNKKGMVKEVNLIVATCQNNAGMNLSVKKAAERLIKNGACDEAILDRIEMAFRAYDPCLACATHCLPGGMPLEVRLRQNGGLVRRLTRNLP